MQKYKLELAMGGDAKYIGVKADGLAEQRQALENDKEQAAERGARLLDFGDTARQSGDALRIRVAARTTNLTTLAQELGTSRLNVSEALNAMQADGVLHFSRGIISVPQVEKLR
jgi:hypothetical protein